ncbi:MAG: EAL domain-containing protein, partial [Gammaproteobacteria bacterium]
LKASGKDVPFLVVYDKITDKTILDLMQAGARDVAPKDQPERLQLVVGREFNDLEERRAHRRVEKMYRESEKRCRSLLDSSRDAIAYVHEGMHIYANAVYLTMFGYQNLEDVEGTPIMDMVAADDHPQFKDFLRQYAKQSEGMQQIEIQGMRSDGTQFNVGMEFTPASIDAELCTQIIIRDLSFSSELESRLKSLSKEDLLTGLYNRHHFMEELEAAVAIATSGGEACVLLYVGLDNFSKIQENVGIAASDLVLGDIAALLRGKVNDADLPARFGDDVFTILVRNQDVAHALKLAEELRKAVEDNVSDAGGQSVTTTCSIGVIQIGENTPDSREILNRVSRSCITTQSAGGNKVYLYNPVLEDQSAKARLQQWVSRLQDAVTHQRLRLLYQPIVNLHGAPQELYQVLLRMQDEHRNEIPPDEFIPAAEETGLNPSIDRWVIEHAIEALAAKRRSGAKTRFFIKLCGETIKDENLLPWLSERIKAARLEGDSLIFEVSESAAFNYLKNTQMLVKGLKELHCNFALSHFGCDANSINNLKRYPAGVTYLKIDSSLLTDMAANPQNQATVKAINEAAHPMQIMTIGERVQDAGSLAVLWQLGVDYVQGYYLQKPSEALDYDFSGEGG